MKRFNKQTVCAMAAFVIGQALHSLADEKTIPNRRSDKTVPISLEDGIYPVASPEDLAALKREPNPRIVELANVPVEGDKAEIATTIRVVDRPLLQFRDLTKLSFDFKENSCTEVGFRNTAELRAYSRDRVGARLAVVIGDKVITHHKIREPITSDEVRITFCTEGGGTHLHQYLKQFKLNHDRPANNQGATQRNGQREPRSKSPRLNPAGTDRRQVRGAVSSVEYSPDGNHVVAAAGNLIHMFDAKTGDQQFAIKRHQGRVWRVSYSPNGRLLESTRGLHWLHFSGW